MSLFKYLLMSFLIFFLINPLLANFIVSALPYKVNIKEHKRYKEEGVQIDIINKVKTAITHLDIIIASGPNKGKKLTTLKKILDIKQIKKVLGKGYEIYKRNLSIKSDNEFLLKVLHNDSAFLFYTLVDAGLAKILATRYLDTQKRKSPIKYKVVGYNHSKKIIQATSKKVIQNRYPLVYNMQSEDFKVQQIGNEILVRWKHHPDMVFYNVYLSEEQPKKNQEGKFNINLKKWYKINHVPIVVFENTTTKTKKLQQYPGAFSIKTISKKKKLKKNKTYYIAIRAINLVQMQSKIESIKFIALKSQTSISLPILNNIPKNTKKRIQAKLSWSLKDKKNLKGINILRYEKKISNKPIILNSILIPKDITTFIDKSTFKPNLLYYYAIEAIGHNGKKALSIPKAFLAKDLNPLSVPEIQSIKALKAGIEIKIKNIDLINKTINFSHYAIYRKESLKDKYTYIVGRLTNKENTFLDKTVSSTILYCYIVKSVTKAAISSKASKETCIKPIANTSLSPITSLYVKQDINFTAFISWKYTYNINLKGFNIYRKKNNEKSFNKINKILLKHTINSFRDYGLKEGDSATYYIVVVAKSNLESRPSIRKKITLKYTSPSKVQHFRVYQSEKFYNEYTLTWNYLDSYDFFKIQVQNNGKVKDLATTKKKQYRFKAPKNGQYRFFITAVKKGLSSDKVLSRVINIEKPKKK